MIEKLLATMLSRIYESKKVEGVIGKPDSIAIVVILKHGRTTTELTIGGR